MSVAYDVEFQILICRREKMITHNTMNALRGEEPNYLPESFEELASDFGELLVKYPKI